MPDTMMPEWNPPSLEGRVSDAEWEVRVDLAAAFRVSYHFGWNNTINNHISARVPDEPEHFVMNPRGLGWHEVTASSLIKSDYNGNDLSESELNLAPAGRNFHGAILDLRRDLNCVFHMHAKAGVVISATEDGFFAFDQGSSMLVGNIAYHDFRGLADEADEGPEIVEDLGANKMMIMRNHGLLTVGGNVGEAFALMHRLADSCATLADLLMTNSKINRVPDEVCKVTQDQIAGRRKGDNQPDGGLEWKMYRRLAEKLDPSYRT